MNKPSGAERSRVSTEGWTPEFLVGLSDNFHPIERVKANASKDEIKRAVTRYEEEGIPMIIEGWHEHEQWPKDMFTLDFFREHTPGDVINVRNVHDLKDSTIPLDDFIAHCREVPTCAPEGEQTRMYGKDAECPEDWKRFMETSDMLPSQFMWNGPNDYFRYRPKSAPVETLMCYLGIGDTFTAAHKDLCASSGHNLMCYTEKDGASYWFMTKGSAAPDVEDFFRELGQELDHEIHVVTLEQLKTAPFDIYIGKQVLGDLVLVPPRSCHQVVNAGGITLKTSWSRMSLKGLSVALYHELPLYQRVCRFETYRIKSTIYHAVQRQTDDLESIGLKRLRAKESGGGGLVESQLLKNQEDTCVLTLTVLLRLFQYVLSEEFHPGWKQMKRLDTETATNLPAADLEISCDFCGCDIFQSFFECSTCRLPDPDGASYFICIRCYVEGRTCKCQSMKPMQVRSFHDLIQTQQRAFEVLQVHGNDTQPLTFGPDHRALFVAACKLHRQRLDNHTHTCVLDRTRSWGLNCRACHNSKCYDHLLTNYNLHPSDAILCHAYDDKAHTLYHKLHKTHRDLYITKIGAIKDCQRLGELPSPELAPYMRTHIALTHGSCRPVVFARSSPGWHDNTVQDCDEVAEEGSEVPKESLPVPQKSHRSHPPPSLSPSHSRTASSANMLVDSAPPADDRGSAAPSAVSSRRGRGRPKKASKGRQDAPSRGSLRSTRSSGRLAGKDPTPAKSEPSEPTLPEATETSAGPSRLTPEAPPMEIARSISPPRPPRLKRLPRDFKSDAKGKSKATEPTNPTPSATRELQENQVFAQELSAALSRANDVDERGGSAKELAAALSHADDDETEYDQLDPSPPSTNAPPKKKRGRPAKPTESLQATGKRKASTPDMSSTEDGGKASELDDNTHTQNKKMKHAGSVSASASTSKPASASEANSRKRKVDSEEDTSFDDLYRKDSSPPSHSSVTSSPVLPLNKRQKRKSSAIHAMDESSLASPGAPAAKADQGLSIKSEPIDSPSVLARPSGADDVLDMSGRDIAWNLNDPIAMREHISRLVDEAVRRAVPTMQVSASVTPAPEGFGSPAAISFIVNINPPHPQPSPAQSTTPSQNTSQPCTSGTDQEHNPAVVSVPPSLPRKPVQPPEAVSRNQSPPATATAVSPPSKKVIYERPAITATDSSTSTAHTPPGITAVSGLPSRPKGSFGTQTTNQARSRTLVPTKNNGGSVGSHNRPPQQPSQIQARSWGGQPAGTSASAPLIRIGETLPAVDLSSHQDYPNAPPISPYPPPYHVPAVVPHAPAHRPEDVWSGAGPRYPPPPSWPRTEPPSSGARMSFTANDVPLPATHGRPWGGQPYPPHPPIPHPGYAQGHAPGQPPLPQYGPPRYPPSNYDPWAA